MSAEAEAGTRRRRSPLLITVLILGVLALLVVLAAHLYTNYLWFRSVSATTVFTTQLAARVGLFLGFGLLLVSPASPRPAHEPGFRAAAAAA